MRCTCGVSAAESQRTYTSTYSWLNPAKSAKPELSAGQLFSPQSRALGINQGNYNPEVLKTIVYAGTQFASFAQGSAAFEALGGLNISTKQVERVTERIGQERIEQHDQAVQAFLALPLMDRCKSPVANPLPESSVATVMMMDSGRLQILDRSKPDPDLTETGDNHPPERNEHWREDKIGLLMTMTSKVSANDPCPEISENFVDPTRILKLAREIKGHVSGTTDKSTEPPESEGELMSDAGEKTDAPATTPKPRVRMMVAIREPAERFGEILAWAGWREASPQQGARRSSPTVRRPTGQFRSDGSATMSRSWISFTRCRMCSQRQWQAEDFAWTGRCIWPGSNRFGAVVLTK